jgi:N6-adenosine-specific RNA methylase IME4
MDRAADNHYPTSTTDIIAARPVADIAADDCVLLLWATAPMLREAIRVLEAWGFEYKSHAIWDKIHIGTGYWFQNRHEVLLLGVRGNPPAPAMGDQFASVFAIARKEHSAKPEQFHELIQQYFPHLPKIEVNRRGPPRPGWDAWGNEIAVSRPTTPAGGADGGAS